MRITLWGLVLSLELAGAEIDQGDLATSRLGTIAVALTDARMLRSVGPTQLWGRRSLTPSD